METYDGTNDITDHLRAWSDGESTALDELVPLVYDELHRIARVQLAREEKDHTLQPTAVVNELFLDLMSRRRLQWENRSNFFGFAAQQMRRILVSHARKRRAAKRGGDLRDLSLEDSPAGVAMSDDELLGLDVALRDLERFNPEGCRIVVWRFFGGLTHEQIAQALGVSRTTVRNKWRAAKWWLYRELRGEGN